MSRFMISPLGNSPVSAWSKVPNVHTDSLCHPVEARRTRRNPNPRLTPWGWPCIAAPGCEKFALMTKFSATFRSIQLNR
jgi:hypothetical protein